MLIFSGREGAVDESVKLLTEIEELKTAKRAAEVNYSTLL